MGPIRLNPLAISGVKVAPHLQKPERPALIRTLLIIDDNFLMSKILARTINQAFGITVTYISDSVGTIEEQALEQVKYGSFDMIFMDGNLTKGTSGEKITARLRTELKYAGYIVGISDDDGRKMAMLANGADFSILEHNEPKTGLSIARLRTVFIRH